MLKVFALAVILSTALTMPSNAQTNNSSGFRVPQTLPSPRLPEVRTLPGTSRQLEIRRAPDSSGIWRQIENVDPITDDIIMDAVKTNRDGSRLTVRCQNRDTLMVHIRFGMFEYVSRDRDVTYRSDNKTPVTFTWQSADNGSYIHGQNAMRVAIDILNSREKFALRSGNSTVVFSINNSTQNRAILQRTVRACR